MSKRLQVITKEALENLFVNHPYIQIFQKKDWAEYLLLIAQVYDLLEEQQSVIPYESFRSLLIQHYSSSQKLESPEQKAHQFVTMSITDLQVLKDRYNHLGQRFIETTRSGKELLKLVENLLQQKVRYTGLTADTMLAALNNLLVQNKTMSEEEALIHHREKIRSYQEDLKRIQKFGVSKAELLPGEYSKEELLQQAEESALHILTAVEDVKMAIERVRRQLAEGYFKEGRSAGQNINLVVNFYQELERTPEYRSYNQAFDLLSYIDGLGGRFRLRDVDEIISEGIRQTVFERSEIEKSHLVGFKNRFYRDHHNIEEKRKLQLQLLQQQVMYAISNESKTVEKDLRESLSLFHRNKNEILSHFKNEGMSLSLPSHFSWGEVFLNAFEVPVDIPKEPLVLNGINQEEAQTLARALMEAEEATIQKTLERLRVHIKQTGAVLLSDYELQWGLTEYYVLLEADTFAQDIVKEARAHADIQVKTRYGDFVIRGSTNFLLSSKDDV